MIDEIRALAEEAGAEIRRYYRQGGWSVTAKPDDSPVTHADLASNAILTRGLERISSAPIISEESVPFSKTPSEKFWLIDPLDGTRDFVAQLDTFVICIALIHEYFPVLGLIHAPVTGETWWAEKGRGAFDRNGKKLLNTERRQDLVAAGSRSFDSESLEFLQQTFQIQEFRKLGSALKFCHLAEGKIDLYPRFGGTHEWDTAAGQIIAEEAGCKVVDLDGGLRLRYGKNRFYNQNGFVASRSDLNPEDLLIKGSWSR